MAVFPADGFHVAAERFGKRFPHPRKVRAQDPDDRDAALLCLSHQWPRRAADQRDELAPSAHSITSSAATCRLCGTASPNALAVLRLITNSNRLG